MTGSASDSSELGRVGSRARGLPRLSRDQLGVFALSFGGVALLAANGGGYLPTAWGWASLVLLWLIALALLFKRAIEVSKFELAQLAALAGLLAWVLLSATWSS